MRPNASEPWRELYLTYQDGQLYDIVNGYFKSVDKVLWSKEQPSRLQKTIGVQALFDLLKYLAETNTETSFDEAYFDETLAKIDLVALDNLDQNYSGHGRSQIKNMLIGHVSQS
jgi:hypothetical protein